MGDAAISTGKITQTKRDSVRGVLCAISLPSCHFQGNSAPVRPVVCPAGPSALENGNGN